MAKGTLEGIDRVAKTLTINGEIHSFKNMEVKWIGSKYVPGATIEYTSKDNLISFCKITEESTGEDVNEPEKTDNVTPKPLSSFNSQNDYWKEKAELDKKRDNWLGWQGALSVAQNSVASLSSKNTEKTQHANEVIAVAELYHNFLKSKTS